MRKKGKGEDNEKTKLLADQPIRSNGAKTFHDNEDVSLERQKVIRKDYPRGAPLVVDDLTKQYPGADKFSLQELYLAVESGECFSLLGENGAGKSTTISLLTGLYPPTRGTALIAGHDITTEMDQARLALGVCPQFNVLWDTLTVGEHLLFYARLKGVPPKEEKEHTQMWLTELGLTFAADRPSASLSGGMKRRVSVGIALVGNPKVVFLDEPTTGLDPASRRHLWTILERARTGRAIILTTHSMDEAEVLSNRIGIMALGSLRCIGTPQHLKNSVGNLFHLKINFAQENIKIAENFVYSLFPNATLIRTYKGTSEFHIPQTNILVSDVFAKMEASSEANSIIDWSFSQVGLEEVFQMVVEDSHKI